MRPIVFAGTRAALVGVYKFKLVLSVINRPAHDRVKKPPQPFLGCPGQRYEAGKAFGCSVKRRRALTSFVSREAVPAPKQKHGNSGALVGVYSSIESYLGGAAICSRFRIVAPSLEVQGYIRSRPTRVSGVRCHQRWRRAFRRNSKAAAPPRPSKAQVLGSGTGAP